MQSVSLCWSLPNPPRQQMTGCIFPHPWKPACSTTLTAALTQLSTTAITSHAFRGTNATSLQRGCRPFKLSNAQVFFSNVKIPHLENLTAVLRHPVACQRLPACRRFRRRRGAPWGRGPCKRGLAPQKRRACRSGKLVLPSCHQPACSHIMNSQTSVTYTAQFHCVHSFLIFFKPSQHESFCLRCDVSRPVKGRPVKGRLNWRLKGKNHPAGLGRS